MPAEHFKSITVSEALYVDIQELARQSGKKISRFVGDLIAEYKRLRIFLDILGEDVNPERLVLEQIAWRRRAILHAIFKNKEIEFYKSTAWIRSKEYPKKAGVQQWPDRLQARVEEDPDFTFEKILIVSTEAFDKTETWQWFLDWATIKAEYPRQVGLYVVDQRDADKITEEYPERIIPDPDAEKNSFERDRACYDMGIYGKKAVGFLPIDKRSEPGHFRLDDKPSVLQQATWWFRKLKKCAMPMSEVMEKVGEKALEIPLELSEEDVDRNNNDNKAKRGTYDVQ